MTRFWQALQGRKTYLLALICTTTVLLHALADRLEGRSVDQAQVIREILVCLMAMAIRHGLANGHGKANGGPDGNGNGGGSHPPPRPACNGPCRAEYRRDELFDR